MTPVMVISRVRKGMLVQLPPSMGRQQAYTSTDSAEDVVLHNHFGILNVCWNLVAQGLLHAARHKRDLTAGITHGDCFRDAYRGMQDEASYHC
jgi:hypothetical protein